MEAFNHGRKPGQLLWIRSTNIFFTLSYVFQVNYQFQVAAGDPDYVNFWQRLESNPEEALFKDIGEGETKKRPIAFLPHFAPPYVISQNGKMLDFF